MLFWVLVLALAISSTAIAVSTEYNQMSSYLYIGWDTFLWRYQGLASICQRQYCSLCLVLYSSHFHLTCHDHHQHENEVLLHASNVKRSFNLISVSVRESLLSSLSFFILLYIRCKWLFIYNQYSKFFRSLIVYTHETPACLCLHEVEE